MNALQLLSSLPFIERLGWTLVHFLWQGALIAALYAVARRWLVRSSSANTRYILACSVLATMMVVPIVTLSLMRASGAASVSVELVSGGRSGSTDRGAALPASVQATGSSVWPERFLPWVVGVWFVGAIVFWVRLMGGWAAAARLRSTRVRPAPEEWQHVLRRLGTRIGLHRPVRLLVSAVVQAPIVIGWLRPVVLIPIGALSGLPPEHIEAVLIHELAHIRRHDYLVNILQSVAEALLFYHPAVWWVSGDIRIERELCCDDIAVRVSGDALTYARALAELESFRPVRLHAVVAAGGGSLADRIGRLLGQPRPAPRTFSAPGLLVSALLLAATTYVVFAQSAGSPRFDVVTITLGLPYVQGDGIVRAVPGGGLIAEKALLRFLIQNAYGVESSQISGAPDWVNLAHYDIEAKAAAASPPQMLLMLQALLEDKFKLQVHREIRELPVYTLSPATSGIKLQQPQEGSCYTTIQRDGLPPAPMPPPPRIVPGQPIRPNTPPCGRTQVSLMSLSEGYLVGGRISMAELTRDLSLILGGAVVDNTGFTGTFDVHLAFKPDEALAGLRDPGSPAPEPVWGAIFTAMQEQLGLKADLEKETQSREILVIDHVQKLTQTGI